MKTQETTPEARALAILEELKRKQAERERKARECPETEARWEAGKGSLVGGRWLDI